MTDIAKEFRSYLLSKPAVVDLVGSKIYTDQLPQQLTLPCVIMRVISADPEHDVATGDVNFVFTRLQVDSYSDLRSQANTIANTIRKTAGVQGYRGTMGITKVQDVVVEDRLEYATDPPTDGSDAYRFISSQTYRIAYEES